jgi:hypothetical protein
MREVILETLKPGAFFWREKQAERMGVVVHHGPGGTLVELLEPKVITIRDRKPIKTTKKLRVQFARQSHVWVK